MKHIYYKNDFAVEITLLNASGEVVSPPDWQWHIEFTDGRRKYICSVDKGNANVVGNTIMCYLDNHKFCCGEIGYKFVQAIPDLNYLDGFQNLITPKALPIELWEQESDNDVNIQSSVVPAYVVYDAYMTAKANGYAGTAEEFYDALNHIVDIDKKEAERVEAEANRVTAEQQRADNFVAMESALTTATSKANTATTKAEEASKRADNSATEASQAMEKTNTATELANTATANANNSAVNAGNAATEANEATKSANDATEKAKTATTAAEQSAERANTAADNADVATSNATTATTQATTATKRANDISADLEAKREADYWRGAKGVKGDDGVSPTVKTSKTGKVTTIEITDANGVHTATVNDGESVEIVQSTGTSETAVMSQKAVSDALSNVYTKAESDARYLRGGFEYCGLMEWDGKNEVKIYEMQFDSPKREVFIYGLCTWDKTNQGQFKIIITVEKYPSYNYGISYFSSESNAEECFHIHNVCGNYVCDINSSNNHVLPSALKRCYMRNLLTDQNHEDVGLITNLKIEITTDLVRIDGVQKWYVFAKK